MWKGVLKLLAAAMFGALAVVGGLALVAQADKKPPPAPPVIDAPSTPVVQPVLRLHNYDVQDGAEYGYTAAISEEQQRAGQVGNNVLMFFYAGEREGKHQVHLHKGSIIQAFECSAPCEVIKAMTVIDEDGLRRQVNVERLRAVPNMIAAMALEDALGGKLRAYEQHNEGRRFEVWVDERKGLWRRDIGAVKTGVK